jgi:hypothetical protein
MKLFLVLLALSSVPALAADSAKVSGYISDSKCGAMHSSANPNTACVKKCIAGGGSPVFVDDDKKQVYTIDDPALVKDQYGHHVSVVAKVDDSGKTIHIASVTTLPDQGKQATSDMHGMCH